MTESPTTKFYFSEDPTARGDEVCSLVREWYEANRESWWTRHMVSFPEKDGIVADLFIFGLIQEVHRVTKAAKAGFIENV